MEVCVRWVCLIQTQSEVASFDFSYHTLKRSILIQVLPRSNTNTKSASACIHYAKSFCYLHMHVCIVSENCN